MLKCRNLRGTVTCRWSLLAPPIPHQHHVIKSEPAFLTFAFALLWHDTKLQGGAIEQELGPNGVPFRQQLLEVSNTAARLRLITGKVEAVNDLLRANLEKTRSG